MTLRGSEAAAGRRSLGKLRASVEKVHLVWLLEAGVDQSCHNSGT